MAFEETKDPDYSPPDEPLTGLYLRGDDDGTKAGTKDRDAGGGGLQRRKAAGDESGWVVSQLTTYTTLREARTLRDARSDADALETVSRSWQFEELDDDEPVPFIHVDDRQTVERALRQLGHEVVDFPRFAEFFDEPPTDWREHLPAGTEA